MICLRCHKVMKQTMHFEKGRQFKYNQCPCCHEKTRNKRINFDTILEEEIEKTTKTN